MGCSSFDSNSPSKPAEMIKAPYYNVHNKKFDLQGHRGGRGLWPENTLYGFENALDLGVTTLEMDVVLSGDDQVVVSHDPFFNPHICQDDQGRSLSEDTLISLYKINYEAIARFDCGSKSYPRFPDQEKCKAAKPLLKDVIKHIEQKINAEGKPRVLYNIEIKSRPEWEGEFQPASPDFYVQTVMDTIKKHLTIDRYTIQSFDPRILRSLQGYDSKIKLVYLLEETELTEDMFTDLDFHPTVISTDFNLLSKNLVSRYQEQGFLVIPWTVNKEDDMKRLIEWGVDGIITDYPNRLKKVTVKD